MPDYELRTAGDEVVDTADLPDDAAAGAWAADLSLSHDLRPWRLLTADGREVVASPSPGGDSDEA